MEVLSNWLAAPDAQATVIAAMISGIFGLIARYWRTKPNLTWGTTHGFIFAIPQANAQPNLAYTMTVIVQNMGRVTAEGIEVYFTGKPQHFQLWPSFNYSSETAPDGCYIVKVNNLGHMEYFSIELLSTTPLPEIMRVRTKDGDGRKVPIRFMRQYPSWVLKVVATLMFLGVFAIIQNFLMAIF